MPALHSVRLSHYRWVAVHDALTPFDLLPSLPPFRTLLRNAQLRPIYHRACIARLGIFEYYNGHLGASMTAAFPLVALSPLPPSLSLPLRITLIFYLCTHLVGMQRQIRLG